MQPLYHQLGLDQLAITPKVLATFDKIVAGVHGYEDNGPVQISIERTPSTYDDDGRRVTSPQIALLQTLARHKIIAYKTAKARLIASSPTSTVYRVYIVNRYAFERLSIEIDQRYSNRFAKSQTIPAIDNLIYYNPSTGKLSANGIKGKLKRGSRYKNREIFNLALRSMPKPADRDDIIKILKLTSTKKYSDTDRTYGINKAIDNLRDALHVNKDVLSLKNDGLHLNATVIQVEKIPEDFRFTD